MLYRTSDAEEMETIVSRTRNMQQENPKRHVWNDIHANFEGRMWDLIVSVPEHYLSFYFT